MKTIIKVLILIFILIYLYSCSNDTIVNTVTSTAPFTLNGTIENWTLGGNIKLKAELFNISYFTYVVLDSTIVNANGAFTLKLKDVPDSLLYPITFYTDTSCIVNVTVNPSNTKSSFNPNLTYPGGLDLYNDSSQIGFIYRSNYSPDTIPIPGWFFAHYLYLNQNVSITGSIVCNNVPSQDTTIYNFSGTRGWNKVVLRVNSYTPYGSKVTVSATEPAGGKWRAYLMTNDALSNKLSLIKRMFSFNSNCVHCK